MANRPKTFKSNELAKMGLTDTAERQISPESLVAVACGCGATGETMFKTLRHKYLARGVSWRCGACYRQELRARGLKNAGQNNPFAGKRHSKATRAKMQVSAKARWEAGAFERQALAEIRDKIQVRPANRRLINEMSQQLVNLGLENQDIFLGGHEIHMLFPIARVGVQVLNPLNVSEPLVGKQWALDAHKFFLERQIRLIQFYEHELVQRFGQVKNYIARAVGYIEKWIPVEGLEVVELSAEEAKVFFAAHHIKSVQVNGSALRLGLRQAGVLVAAAVFGRRGKDMMLRGYCEKDRIVVGNGLLAMCDIARSAFGPLSASLPIRLDDGGLFLGNGWTVDRLGAPGHGLVDLNGNIAPGTRQSATESADFVKFYDAGKIFFVFA